jgi:CheY-like chemotaxis protein
MRPALASSATEALTLLFQAKDQGDPFPLMLTDAHMPAMDGFTLVEHLKREPQLTTTLILMLTATEQKAAVACYRQLGIAVYLIKPIKPIELQQAMVRALEQEARTKDRHNSYPLPSHNLQSLHILLAEDNAVNQKLAVRLLEKRGHSVVVAGNGKEALAALERETFDFILMDVQMPEMDGLEATAIIRAKERGTHTHIPIIALTAHAMKGDRERCLAAGMDEYISKPLKTEDLFAAIKRVVTPITRHSDTSCVS